jgi:hypothetical protein
MKLRPIPNSIFYGMILLGLIPVVLFALGKLPIGVRTIVASPVMQPAHAIGLGLYSYANDHEGNYPPGKSSTEVFQVLLDGDYETDPSIFYQPMQGKRPAVAGEKLKPENVCWDYTVGTTTNSPGVLPLIFTTGYRVTYATGADAVPYMRGFSEKGDPIRTWTEWWNNVPDQRDPYGIAAFYINNSARYNKATAIGGSIPNFVSPDYKPDGKTYRQLTPDGVLPP